MVYVTNIDEVEQSEMNMDIVSETYVQWMLDDRIGAPNFALRRFVIKPGGEVGLHTHPWEHEVYVLSGKGSVTKEGEKFEVEAGSAAYVEPEIRHGFKNESDEDFVFLCIVPKEGFRPKD